MAKLLKLRRGTTSQHSSFTGAEGEVTVDTDKETLVVHDGSTAGGHPVAAEDMANVSSASIAGRLANDSIATSKIGAGALPTDVTVASANIVNGTIVNEDINGAAAIAGTKIAPSFGSQTVVAQKVQISDAGSPTLEFLDTDAGPDYKLLNADGVFGLFDETNGVYRAQVQTDGHIDLKSNVDCEAGLDVTGNITVTGTVDGVDVATRDTLFGGLTSSSGVLSNGVTATTQSASDNSTKVATTAYTDTAISNLVDSSPGALNTLNELAATINDDASFSTTVTNNIATKMPLAGGEFTGDVTCHNITPDGDSSRDLGTNSVRFANVYADNFVGAGGNLTGIEGVPAGVIALWSGATNAIPSGWVICDGNNSTPDLRDRFVVGAGNSYSVGATGGASTVTLSTSQIPSHNHSGPSVSVQITTRNNGGGAAYTAIGRGRGAGTVQTTNADGVSVSVGSIGNTGGGGSHENKPPYYALAYIQKT